jgi:transcriptional regulator of PTS gene
MYMMFEKTPSQQLMKNMNQQKVLHLIYSAGAISRVELADKTGLTQQTVTNIVNRLLQDKVVIEGTPVASGGGRKPIPLSVNHANLYAIGVEVAVKRIRAVLHNFQRETLDESEVLVDSFRDEAHTLQCVREAVDRIASKLGAKEQVKGIGLSIQGLVDSKQGTVLYSEKLRWMQFNLREALEQFYPFPIYIENDVNIMALVENMDGLLFASDNNITCKLDEGIGGAVVCGKQLHTGSSHVAGEFGHYKAFRGRQARPCHCGGRGCLTTVTSIGGMEEVTGLSFAEIVARLRSGDAEMTRYVASVGEAVAEALANIVTFMNPDHVLLTGRIVEEAGFAIVPIIEKQMMRNIPVHCRNVRLVYKDRSQGGADMAAGLVIKQMFAAPVNMLSY